MKDRRSKLMLEVMKDCRTI